MNELYLYDDLTARRFEPFALTRPASELRVGAELTRRRWETVLGARAAGFFGAPHLDEFAELDAPPAARGTIPAGSIVANARGIPRLAPAPSDRARADVWTCDGRVAALRLRADLTADERRAFADGSATLEDVARQHAGGAASVALEGRWLDDVWAVVRDLPAQLADDVPLLAAGLAGRRAVEPSGQVHVIGPAERLHVEEGAVVEPFTVFDTSAGPILLRRGSTVHSFTRVIGPCYVGEGSSLTTDRVASCSIGDRCRVHGEISVTVMLGHANKSHDGFVGHSYLGRWVNLGAGTITSNLKNTYGPVALWTPDGIRDTGMQFLGTLFGDHAKTGIGLRLTTGSVVGAGANVYGSEMPGKYVPPFSWGEAPGFAPYQLDKFLAVAERAMARRDVALDGSGRAQLAAAYGRSRAG